MDDSKLDSQYFVTNDKFNCPHCNRRHVSYKIEHFDDFNWDLEKACFAFFIKCISCKNKSMHLTYEAHNSLVSYSNGQAYFKAKDDLDSKFFYSVPTSFFVLDSRIPKVLRELITEAEQCKKMNLLTGASACTRKAIYELTILQKAVGKDYEAKIKSLKSEFPQIDSNLFDILSKIQGMTSDKVHEQSWDKWSGKHIQVFLDIMKTILHEIYVIPDNRKKSSDEINSLYNEIKNKKEQT